MSRQNISDFGTTVANTSHLSTLAVYPNMTGVDSIIFANNSCILNPEGEVGPYYVQGEYVRSDISEDQAGVPLYLEQQYININTCEPIEDLYADIWHCNATGVYAGVVANGNGDSDDETNLDATFLRGIQKTDENGVVSWESVFPGYYQGRTTHVHMVTHMGASQLSNGTITGGNVTHVGQLMFDQDLTDEINENVYPYTTNIQSLTTNTEDSVFIAETLTDSDPVVNYVKMSDDIEDGIFAWITIGVDPGASYNASAAAVLAEDGGYETGNTQVM